MQDILLSPIPLAELETKITQIVSAALEQNNQKELQEKLLSPSEVCKIFQPNISKVTLHAWEQAGKLQAHRIGGRVYYKYSELMESLQTLKKYRRV